jgi:ribosomal protein S18 acetylase RimI-like enzyme
LKANNGVLFEGNEIDNSQLRLATSDDLSELISIEQTCFQVDKLSRRQMKYWIQAAHGILLVVEKSQQILAYGLVILRKGSRSARLYSIAVMPQARGRKIAQMLLADLERISLSRHRLFMRLEVAQNNNTAIAMYKNMGYRKFGIYNHYYENGVDALRFQKTIQQSFANGLIGYYPWYKQSTDFTCGPSALMMAMKHLRDDADFNQISEIDIWRQATTIFMTSGHGGCHPLGLALAATDRGFIAEVYLTHLVDLFVDGVRSVHKKSIMRIVEQDFIKQANEKGIALHEEEVNLALVEKELAQGSAVICLISTYQFDGKKAPHWVAITHVDKQCLYLHDPDGGDVPDINEQTEAGLDPESSAADIDLDYQHLPILKTDFASLSVFGKSKLRACIVIKLPE